jgi:hypothetical protein
MRLVIKNSIQLCLRTLVFSIVLRHSNYNNRIISIEGHPVYGDTCICTLGDTLYMYISCGITLEYYILENSSWFMERYILYVMFAGRVIAQNKVHRRPTSWFFL